ncbi:c-type cytochrome [Andreprevotia chitinilytica]|uniref:c-type cytochrome n=1 Tax=Andreprevotia chitinilytica TaxID=396808 RepID=UPI0005552823|nr:cytochrome c [Andreprevotia chitinilytica]
MPRFALFAALIAAFSLAACQRVDPNSPQGKRQTEMKQLLKLSEQLSGMSRGRQPFVVADFQRVSTALQQAARTPWQHFPEYNAAKPVDARAAKAFGQATANFEAATDHLAAAAKTGSLDDVRPAVWKVEDSCSACHRVFRPE